MYQKPSEFVVWEVATIARELRQKKKGKEKQDKEQKQDGSKDAMKMSLANTGFVRRKMGKKQPKGKFAPTSPNTTSRAKKEALEVNAKIQDPFEALGWNNRSNSNPSLSSSADFKRRPGSASPVLSRQSSAAPKNILSSGGILNSAQPHHVNHPEKYVSPDLLKSGLVRSRSSSLTNLFTETIRPKTPPSPHHHNHPHKTLSTADGRDVIKNPLAKKSTKSESPNQKRSIKWGAETDWENMAQIDNARRENDNPVECFQEKPLSERKKGDSLHVPLGRVQIDLGPLFFGVKSTSIRINRNLDLLNSCTVKIELDKCLLSEEYSDKLNPLSITLNKVKGMPNLPIPYEKLDKLCEPINAKFRFFNDPYIHSVQIDSTRKPIVEFNSQHIILAGTLEAKDLIDMIRRNPLSIEIHDRDYRYSKPSNAQSNGFYESGIIQNNLSPHNFHGIAKFDLCDIIQGLTSWETHTVILPSPKNTNKEALLQQGNWVESCAQFSISISMKKPLLLYAIPANLKPLLQITPVYIVTKLSSAVKTITEFLIRYNSKNLNLEGNLVELERQLGFIKLSEDEKNHNVLSGYHLLDKVTSVLYIEGPSNGIEELCDYFQKQVEDGSILIRLDPLKANSRVRPLISPMLLNIQIEPTVHEIFEWTSTYLQKNINADCYQCIELLSTIMKTLNNGTIRKRSFPLISQRMIFSLLKSYGKILTLQESLVLRKPPTPPSPNKNSNEKIVLDPSVVKESLKIESKTRLASAKACSHKPLIDTIVNKRYSAPKWIKLNARKNYVYKPKYDESVGGRVVNHSIQNKLPKQVSILKHSLQKEDAEYQIVSN